MNYADLIQRTARVLWERKHLMVLGTLFVILTGGVRFEDLLLGPVIKPLLGLLDVPVGWLPAVDTQWLARLLVWVAAHGTLGWASLVGVTILLAIVLGVTALVMRGALIASAGVADEPIGLVAALKVGWRRAWRLILIASIPPIPITIAAILVVILVTVIIQQVGGLDALSASTDLRQQVVVGLLVASSVILFPFLVVSYILGLLSTLADRACVLEDRHVIESYRRGWQVLRTNMGSAVLLALLHIVAASVIGSALMLPGLLSMLCLAVAPVLWIVQGVEKAFFLTLWTLVWREWGATSSMGEPAEVGA